MIIKIELEHIKNEIKKNFIDPIPENKLEKFLLAGSKFVRSRLAILYLKSQNISITNEIFQILIAGEIIHSASLLHDDVIDDAQIRRGQQTISKEFNPKISILAGDYLLSYSIEKLLELKNITVLKYFKNCTQKMTEAEIKQLFMRGKKPSIEEYLEICKGKTANLFSTILSCCAEISSMEDKYKENAKLFGETFGLYFQIKNDLNLDSAIIDKQNEIYTAIDIIGIEKTNNLLDNYKEEMRRLIKDFPKNDYKKGLEDLINFYD